MLKMSRAEKQEIRLRRYTSEWSALEQEKRRYYKQNCYNNNFSTTVIQTLYYMQDRIDYLVFQIVKKVDWFISNDEDFDNELAVEIYNQHSDELHNGITTLMHHYKDR